MNARRGASCSSGGVVKVFISSLISGFEEERRAVESAVTTLKHTAVMAEQFVPQPNSPQVACLQGVRQSDLVLLVLGGRYGTPGASGISPTHEEYREAKGRRPVIAFVQEGVTQEPAQAEFVREVQGWEQGLFRGGFKTPDELKSAVILALHTFEVASAAGPIDAAALLARALGLLPSDRGQRGYWSGVGTLDIAVVGGPLQQLLRPIQIEDSALSRAIHQQALFGEPALFNTEKGVTKDIADDKLRLHQETGASVELDEKGSLLLRLPIERPDRSNRGGFGGSVIIEEHIAALLETALGYTDWALDRIDSTQRLTHVAVVAAINGSGGHLAWRSQQEQDASPNSVTVAGMGREKKPVHVECPRAALKLGRARVVEDLIVPLRRQWKSG
jgi:hypothetical protein